MAYVTLVAQERPNSGFCISSFCCKLHLRISEPSDKLSFQSKQAIMAEVIVCVCVEGISQERKQAKPPLKCVKPEKEISVLSEREDPRDK